MLKDVNRMSQIFESAKKYLLSFDAVTEEMLDLQLNEWKQAKPATLNALFRAMIAHAQNRQGMPNSIGDINNLQNILFDFNPKAVFAHYGSWEILFDTIAQSSYTPPGRMQKDNPKNYWVIFCKSILSISEFLLSFETIENFDTFVQGFYTNEYSRLALPLLLEKEIFGYGFALACDFLKDNGYPEFVKPDTHIIDIANGLGITRSNNQYQVFKDVIVYCRAINKLPYEVDKLFWLVGSGNFYLSNTKINTSKTDFITEFVETFGVDEN